jgi:biopolymer transport protein ExbD/biopolymer transport protein TolR
MSLRRGRARAELNAEINVVSLIDVMMLLLVIFMITAPIMHGGVDVNLPEADVPQVDPDKSGIVVTITGDRIYVGETGYRLSEFRAGFRAIAGPRAKEGVNVAADRSASIQLFMDVMGILQSAGVTKIGILANPPAESERR